AKDDLDARLDALDTALPVINDLNGDGVVDAAEAAIAAATQAVQTAEAKHENGRAASSARKGVISPATQAQLQAIKDQLDVLKDTAQGLVDALPASAAKDSLDARLDALDTVVPAVNDTDSDGIADDVDAAIAAATQAVQTAEAKHDELVEAIAAKNGVISPATQAQLQADRKASCRERE